MTSVGLRQTEEVRHEAGRAANGGHWGHQDFVFLNACLESGPVSRWRLAQTTGGARMLWLLRSLVGVLCEMALVELRRVEVLHEAARAASGGHWGHQDFVF